MLLLGPEFLVHMSEVSGDRRFPLDKIALVSRAE